MEAQKAQFEALFQAHSDAIFRHLFFRLGNRDRAKELTQEVFMKTWQHLVSGKEIQYQKAFLYKIANNLFINEIRTDKVTHSLEVLQEESGYDPISSEPEPEAVSEQAEVLRLLEKLPDSYRQVLVMRYIEGLAVKDIAYYLEEKETAISMRITRAVEKLKTYYQPEET